MMTAKEKRENLMETLSGSSLKKFKIFENEIQMERQVSPQTYCESTGRKAAILGYEMGVFEVWVYPFKIVSELQFAVSIPDYQVVVNGTALAKRLIHRPEMATLVFSHDLFTLEWHLLTPLNKPGCIFLFDVSSYAALELWIRFEPNLIPMWPAGLGGQYTLWLEELKAYFIGEGSKKYTGLVGSPFARKLSNTPGHQLPDEPMKFSIPVSQELASTSYIPVIVTGTMEGKDKAVQQFISLLNATAESYLEKFEHYQRLRRDFLTIMSPEPKLDLALEWAKVSLDKGLADNPHLGKGLVAGYGVSGKSQRPGFAWFFGGDTFLNSLAVNGYGDFETTRLGLMLLRDYQRQDGKIFHELTQSAGLLHWFEDYPYGFYHSETSAFYIVAMHDYWQRSGDINFIAESWNSIKRAYQFCLTADEDHDGLIENSAAGLGAMEIGEMLRQNRVDIYLATLWLQALRGMIALSEFFHEKELAQKCKEQFKKGRQSFLEIFVDKDRKLLNFALLTDGKKHGDQTVWQSVPVFFDLIESEKIENTMRQLGSAAMSTDWGVRGLSNESKYYDPISYNNGSVWPFTTGYVATAQFKDHRAQNGWHNLLANARMTWLDALGWHTELLSGEFYRPVSTSVPHQLFSATGIVNPLIKGLLGIDGDAISRKIKFAPHLPMDWDELCIKNYRCGEERFDFMLQRSNDMLRLEVDNRVGRPFRFSFAPAFGLEAEVLDVLVNGAEHDFLLLPSTFDLHCEIESQLNDKLCIEIKYQGGIEFQIPLPEMAIGAATQGLKLIAYGLSDHVLEMIVEGRNRSEYLIPLKTRFQIEKAEGAEIKKFDTFVWELWVNFGDGGMRDYVIKKIRLYLKK